MTSRPSVRPTAAALCLFLQGTGLLALESAWVKSQVALFGSTPAAPGSVLIACFLGTALGSWWGRAGLGVRAPRFAAAFSASLLPAVLLPVMTRLGGAHGTIWLRSAPVMWGAAFLCILPVCAALGAFFPAVARGVSGSSFVLLYAVQAAGSLLGVAAGSFFLPAAFGYLLTALTGAATLVLAYATLRRVGTIAPDREPAEGQEALPGLRVGLVVAAAGSGVFSVLLQSVWIRLVATHTDSSVYSFGAVSCLVVALLAAAAALVSQLPERSLSGRGLLPWIPVLAVAGGGAAGLLWVRATGGLAIHLVENAQGLWQALVAAAPLTVAGSLFASLLFPALLRRAGGGSRGVGVLIAVNGLGCAAGAALGAFLLLPHLGVWWTLLAALAGYLALIPFLGGGLRAWAAAVLGAAVLAALNPLRHPLVTPADPAGGPPGQVVWAREGSHGTVAVIDYPGRGRTLWLNSTYLLEAFTGDVGSTARMGMLPVALHPRARSLAMIGVGTGITASGFLDSRLERVTLIELIPEVAAAAREHFRSHNRDALADPRVRVVTDDGRRFLSRNPERYDIVCTDLVTPWNEGASALYAAEHLRTVRERLNPGGICVVWLPLFQLTREEFLVIARTMAGAFPSVTFWQLGALSGHAVGALVGADRLSTEEIAAAASAAPGARAGLDPLRRHPSGVFSHYLGPLDPGDPLFAGVPETTLDRPRLEFLAARAGRTLLTGREFLDLAGELAGRPGNPGGRHFTVFTPEMESWRRVGYDMTRYTAYLRSGEYEKAAELEERIESLEAYREEGDELSR